MIIRLRHPLDPMARHWHRWPFVYLHSQAEEVNQAVAADANFWLPAGTPDEDLPYSYSDIFHADVPPPPGQAVLDGELYGLAVRIVVVSNHGLINGRVVCVNDPDGLHHAMRPAEWR